MERPEWQSLLQAARKGDADAQARVASHFENGLEGADGNILVRRHVRRALQWYRKAAEQGNHVAESQLGVLLSSGEGIEPDSQQAIYWCRRAADAGFAHAAHNLGCIYRDRGNHGAAYRWFERAVSMGGSSSLLEMALCLMFGVGVRKSEAEACRLLRRLAGLEDDEDVSPRDIDYANYWLGVAYLGGRGVGRSLARARQALELADRDQDHEAASLLLWITGRGG